MQDPPFQITNPQLRERIRNIGAGLTRVAGLVPQESNVLLLLNDSIGTCLMWHSQPWEATAGLEASA